MTQKMSKRIDILLNIYECIYNPCALCGEESLSKFLYDSIMTFWNVVEDGDEFEFTELVDKK